MAGGTPESDEPRPRMRWDETESQFRRRENAWYMKRHDDWFKQRMGELSRRSTLEHLIRGFWQSILEKQVSSEGWKKLGEQEKLKVVTSIFAKAEEGSRFLSGRKEIPPKLQEALKKGADALATANKAVGIAQTAGDLYEAARLLQVFFEANPLKDQAEFAKKAGGALVAVGKILQHSKLKMLQEAGKALLGAGSFFENCANAWNQSAIRLKSMKLMGRSELGPSNYLYDRP